jgi:hypothetical protein
MQLSRLGQGLAVSAVGALVITGLGTTVPASAVESSGVWLLSQQDGIASVRRDANNPNGLTVTLTAQRLDPAATITFEYNPDPAATSGSAGWSQANGNGITQSGDYATIEWNAADVVGTSVALRAVASVAATDTTPATTTYSTRNNVAVSGDSSPVHAVSLGPSNPFPVPMPTSHGSFFAQPYADSQRTRDLLTVVGTTSATGGTVELSAWKPQAAAFQGSLAAAVSKSPLKVSGSSLDSSTWTYVDGGRFTGTLDITAFDADGGDVLAVRATRDSDSVAPVRLRAQTISSITTGTSTDRTSTTVFVTVRDQDNVAVTGAEVRHSADGSLLGYTDADGQVTEVLPNGTATDGYYVNTTDTDAFEDGTDRATGAFTTPTYQPTATSTEVVLADGDVFDDREYAEGDVALQVLDEYGEPYGAGADFGYRLYESGETPGDFLGVQTDADGRVVVPFDPSGPDGEYTVEFTNPATGDGETQAPVTFTAGDAVLGLTPLKGTGPSGGQISYAGSLTVEGQALPGRIVDLAYTRGTEQAPGTAADADLVIGGKRALSGASTTAADGTFAVTVADLAEPGKPAETGGRLTVTARGLGDTLDATADFAAGPVDPGASTEPSAELPTVTLKLRGANAGPKKDKLRISGPASVAGARVKVFAKVSGKWKVVKTVRLDRKAKAEVTLRDRNGTKATRYYVELPSTATVATSTSKVIRLR